MRLGEMLKERRVALGFTTLDVAKHIPMDERYINQIEISSVVPGAEVLRKISAALGLDGIELERQRRLEYIERDLEKNRRSNKSNVRPVNVEAMASKVVKDGICKCDYHEESTPSGYTRYSLLLHPKAWEQLQWLQNDSVTEIGFRASLDDLICAAIQTIYDCKHGLKDPVVKYKYVPKGK